jgi:hypothetical protein
MSNMYRSQSVSQQRIFIPADSNYILWTFKLSGPDVVLDLIKKVYVVKTVLLFDLFLLNYDAKLRLINKYRRWINNYIYQ